MSAAPDLLPPAASRPFRRPAGRPLLACLLLAAAAFHPACKGGEAGKFKHTGHVTISKGACSSCHGADPAAPASPTEKECVACHPKGAKLYAEFHSLPKESRIVPIPPATYADVIFSHGPHAGAGIPCDGCHALPEGGKKESSYPPMAACKSCHERSGVPVDCPTCHRERR